MALKHAVARALIGGVLYDLMMKTNVYQVRIDDNITLADKLQEVITSLNGKVTVAQLEEAVAQALEEAKASGAFDGSQGEKGDKGDTGATGAQGEPGKDGTSATHSWNGTVLTVTSASGTSSADLKGEKGEKGDTGAQGVQGIQGEPGQKGDTGAKGDKGDTGATGGNGKDGTSITVKNVSESTTDSGSNVVTFSDGKTVTIKNGSKGSTGPTGPQGEDGKSAYKYAQDGGYTGTETEFAEKLASEYTENPLYGKKVSFLGDSICAGSNESTSYLGGYGKIIADRNGMAYENVARGGATVTAETYSRSTGAAKPWLCRMVENMSADSDYAIIEGGINDGWDETVKTKIGTITTGYDATLDDTTYYGAFESMLKQLVTKFQGKKIGYIAVPKIHSLYDSSQNAPNFYHASLECCAKWGVPVCDLNTITPPVEYLSDLGSTYTADACHPTYEGYIKYYCDPIEAWMKTLTTGASVSVGGGSVETDDFVSKKDVQIKKAQLTLEDGSTVLIDVVVASAGTAIQTYLNLVPTSIDTDKSIYNKDATPGWKGQTRLSASSGSVKESTSGASITGYIPVNPGDVVRFKFTKNISVWDQAGSFNPGWNILAYYNSSFTWLGSICPTQSNSVYGICSAADTSSGSVANGGIVSFTVPANSNIEYLRFSFSDQNNAGLDSLIVTVNQEIT